MTASVKVPAAVARTVAALRDRWPGAYRLVRFGLVSAVAMPTTLVLLYVLHGVAGWRPWHANLLAVSVAAVPAYLLNRYWVWGRSGRNRLWGEVLPFWTITLLGAAASTVAVDAAGGRWDDSGLLMLVNVGTYGALWLVKFAVLDRLVWPSITAATTRQDASVPAGAE